MSETISTYRSPWLVSFTDGTPPDDLGDGIHWFPVGPTGDGRVMWRRPRRAPARPYQLRAYLRGYLRKISMAELEKLRLGELKANLVLLQGDEAPVYVERVLDFATSSPDFTFELFERLAELRPNDLLVLDNLWEIAVAARV